MAKSKVPPTAAIPTAAIKRSRTTTEIDDIFSSKPSTSLLPPSPPPAKKKKSKKSKSIEIIAEIEIGKGKGNAASDSTAVVIEKKEKVAKKVEEVIDPSTIIDNFKNAAPIPAGKSKNSGKEGEKVDDAEDRFMDSRGTSRRRMDDGMPIYDISELKIGLGGDTDECPFDCQCCF